MLDLEFLSFVDLNKDKDKVELNAMSKNIVSRTNETMIRLAKMEAIYTEKGLKNIDSSSMDQLQENI